MTRTAPAAPAALRGVRAVVFAVTVLTLAAGAHVAAGGGLPTIPVLLAVGIPVACAAVVLARRVRSLPALVASLGVAQLALHEVFETASATACAPVHGGASGHGVAHHAVAVSCDTMPAMSAHAAPSALMVVLHLVATLATAALLAHGERLLTRLATWAREFVRAVRLPHVPAPARVAVVRREVVRPVRSPIGDDIRRRGPPARFALVLPVTA